MAMARLSELGRGGSMRSKKGLREGLNDDSCEWNESGKIRR